MPAPEPAAQAFAGAGFGDMSHLSAAQREALETLSANLARAALTAQGAIAEGRYPLPSAIGQEVSLGGALEEVVGRLQHMKRRDLAELVHLLD